MSKVVFEFGYKKYVVDTHDAITVLDILTKAELYEQRYDSGSMAYYVYDPDPVVGPTEIKMLPDSLYRMAKLAGRPEK